MRLPKTHALVTATVVALAVGGCAPYELGISTVQDPVLNPDPKHTLRITGRKSEALNLDFRVLYTTANEHCQKPVNIAMGAFSPGAHSIGYPVKQSATEYDVTLFLDSVLPGACRWQAHSILYTASKEGKAMMVPVAPSPLFWVMDSGRLNFPAFEVECEVSAWKGHEERGLWCQKPLGKYFITRSATDARVAFVERPWRGIQPRKLPE